VESRLLQVRQYPVRRAPVYIVANAVGYVGSVILAFLIEMWSAPVHNLRPDVGPKLNSTAPAIRRGGMYM
jgi:hypothetical protein